MLWQMLRLVAWPLGKVGFVLWVFSLWVDHQCWKRRL